MYRSTGTQTSPRLGPSSDSTGMPPWETAALAQVPLLRSKSPDLSQAEREALPILWATRSNTIADRRARLDLQSERANDTNFSSSGYLTGIHGLPGLPSPPHTAYDRSVLSTLTPKSKSLPSDIPQGPPTPPESVSQSSTSTSPSDSVQPTKDINPMTGTMSSRPANATRKTRPAASSRNCSHGRSSSTRLQRWRSVVKDAFVHHSDEGTDFERIEARHWADE